MARTLLCCVVVAAAMSAQAPASLTPAEKADGWKLLFDGTSLAGWRAYQSLTPPTGWRASNGELIRDGEGGDLMTIEQFGDFELRLDWKISKNGNSGVMFRVTTDGEFPYSTGPEFQVLDNAGHKDGENPLTSAGANYAVNPAIKDVTTPVGEWNSIRLLAKGPHVEHWMNGVKLLEYEVGSPDWEARVKASKFATMSGYGRATRGYIVLQDHGYVVTYRNVKIKALTT